MLSRTVVTRQCGQAVKAVLPQRTARKLHIVRATAQKGPFAAFADSIGMPTEEGVFGFKPFAEVWTGRLAMLGFVSSFAVELSSGKGTLQQIGIETPSGALLAFMVGAVIVGSGVGGGWEAYSAFNGQMSKKQKKRYQQFLLLDREEEMIKEARAETTVADRILAPGFEYAQIQAAKAAGTPADRVLSNSPAEEEVSASTSSTTATVVREYVEPAPVKAAAKDYEDIVFYNSELKYARDVELQNGRAAMLGFLAAVLVEAGTGKGIIMQLIMWFKFVGLLGPESGF